MGHEYLHAYYNAIGLNKGYDGNHAQIYQWQSLQEEQWGLFTVARIHRLRSFEAWKHTPAIYRNFDSFFENGCCVFTILKTRPWL